MSGQQRRSPSTGSTSESDAESESEINLTPAEKAKLRKEEASESESDSNIKSRFLIVKREKPAAKAPVADSSTGERGRDVSGVQAAPAEEPRSKRRKETVRSLPATVASPARGEEKGGKAAERASRGTKGTAAAKIEKVKDVPAGQVDEAENGKPQAAGRKRKASSPPPERGQGQKAAKKPVIWSEAVEESLVTQLYTDHCYGRGIPNGRGHPYWKKLLKQLPLEGLAPVHLYDKVRRMRGRYNVLKERIVKGDKPFKSPHEGKIFKLWEGMWGSGTKAPQPSAVEEEEEDEDEEEEESVGPAASAPAPPQHTAEDLSGEESRSENENEYDDSGDAKRQMVGKMVRNATSKPVPDPSVASKPEAEPAVVVSPFAPKPKLASTPLVSKRVKGNLLNKTDELPGGEQHTEALVPADDVEQGRAISLSNDQLKQLREEMLAFCDERVQALEEQRNKSATRGSRDFACSAQGLGTSRMLERLRTRRGRKGLELQKKVREHKIRELQLLSEKLLFLQEECYIEIEELQMQNQA